MPQMIHELDFELVEDLKDAQHATHCVVSDGKLKRRPKLMIALCRAQNIVTLDWLVESHRAGRALPSENYQVVDVASEKKFNFTLARSLNTATNYRKNGKFIFSDFNVALCKKVANGTSAPPLDAFGHLVVASGAAWHGEALPSKSIPNLIVLTSDPITPTQKKAVSKLPSGTLVKPISWFLGSLMSQEL